MLLGNIGPEHLTGTLLFPLSTWVVVLFGEVGLVWAVEWTGTTEEQNLRQQSYVQSLFPSLAEKNGHTKFRTDQQILDWYNSARKLVRGRKSLVQSVPSPNFALHHPSFCEFITICHLQNLEVTLGMKRRRIEACIADAEPLLASCLSSRATLLLLPS